MINNLGFSDVKQVRKSLLIFSLIGLLLKILTKYSTGSIKFLGFEIPNPDGDILPKFIIGIILYYILALPIRYINEKDKEEERKAIEMDRLVEENRDKKVETLKDLEGGFDVFDKIGHHKTYRIKKRIKKSRNHYFIFWLDIIFPILFGITTIILILFI